MDGRIILEQSQRMDGESWQMGDSVIGVCKPVDSIHIRGTSKKHVNNFK